MGIWISKKNGKGTSSCCWELDQASSPATSSKSTIKLEKAFRALRGSLAPPSYRLPRFAIGSSDQTIRAYSLVCLWFSRAMLQHISTIAGRSLPKPCLSRWSQRGTVRRLTMTSYKHSLEHCHRKNSQSYLRALNLTDKYLNHHCLLYTSPSPRD